MIQQLFSKIGQQMLTKIGQQLFLKIDQQLFMKIDQQLFHTIETDGRQASTKKQMFLTYTIKTANEHTTEQYYPTVLPRRAAKDIIMKPRAAPVNSKVTNK